MEVMLRQKAEEEGPNLIRDSAERYQARGPSSGGGVRSRGGSCLQSLRPCAGSFSLRSAVLGAEFAECASPSSSLSPATAPSQSRMVS